MLGELRAHAAVHGPLGVVLFDAHADTWEQYYGERYFHGTPFKRAFEEGLIDPSRSLLAGMRGSLNAASDLDAAADGASRSSPAHQAAHVDAGSTTGAVPPRGSATAPRSCRSTSTASTSRPRPATGTPEVCGLLPHEAIAFLRALRGRTFTGYDLVEVAPAYDTNAQTTALLAANIAYEFLTLTALTRA